MKDWLLGLALAGLALAPVMPAVAGMPICTADGRGKPSPDPQAKPCHAVCERRREG